MTPLHCASFKGHVLVVEALRKMGANIEVTNNVSLIPLSSLVHLSICISRLSINIHLDFI